MKKTCLALVTLMAFLFTSKPVVAETNYAFGQNNKFGIHILSENDLDDAADLVNSNGGAWGYVTLVIREDERDVERWSRAFAQMNQERLIPIVRLATTQAENGWRKPSPKDALAWVQFLEQLHWPTQKKHVLIFNEPNHQTEWGGEINPAEYARVYRSFWEEFKKSDADFSVLPAALDLAAPDDKGTMDAQTFWQKMHEEDELVFTLFDGWNSHSYPNPSFCGSPEDTGRTSIQGYKWEKEELKKYDLNPKLSVFITETGWGCSLLSEATVAQNYAYAFSHIWSDPEVLAVTPFVLNHPHKPFNHFSFKNQAGQFFDFYEAIKSLPKIHGQPILSLKNKGGNS